MPPEQTASGAPAPAADTAPRTTGTGAEIDAEIELQDAERFADVDAQRLRRWLRRLLAALAPEAGNLVVRCVDDDEMRRLNAAWRSKDATTDVLSFPGALRHPEAPLPAAVAAPGLPPGLFPGEPLHAGDLVVSVPVARRQAAARDHGVERELRLLILHGLLHCLGFDHEVDDGTMERFEQRLRRVWLAPEATSVAGVGERAETGISAAADRAAEVAR